jgi:hypothetical protein
MELPVTSLKAFILANFNAYLAAASTTEIPLVSLAPGNLVCGVLDLDRYTDALTAFIIPDNETYEQLSITTTGAECTLSVYIITRKNDPQKLFFQAMRSGECLIRMITEHPTLGGTVAEIQPVSMDNYWGIDGDQNTKGVQVDFRVNYEA